MARKKKTTSEAETTTSTDVSKAEAISDAVKDADFDEPDAAMADTSLEELPEPGSKLAVAGESVAETDDSFAEELPPEPVEEAAAEPVSDQSVPMAAEPKQASGFFGTVLGGVVAAAIGFGGSIYFGAADWPIFGGTADAELDAKFAAQSEALAAANMEISALKSLLSDGQASDAAALETITKRLDALPTTTAELMPEDLRALLAAQKLEMDALQANLDKMSELTEGQIASAQAQQESAVQAEARAKARGALNTLRSALATGDGFASALPDIAAATDVPDVLQANADAGIPSASMLEDDFGAAARNALSASLKATAGAAPSDRVLLFLKDQLGARSLTPQEGDDPDAVLSRVEAAVRSGDLNGALGLISSLPEQGQAELQAWAEMAATRKDALAAFDSLADALSAN